MRNIFSLVVVLVSIAILGVSIYLAVNPQEQQRQKRDEMLYEDVKSFTEGVQNYYKEKKDYPWVTDSIPNETSLLKLDSVLTKLKEVTDFRGFASKDYEVAKIFVTFDQTTNEIKACFLPESKTYLFHANDEGRKTTCTGKKLQ